MRRSFFYPLACSLVLAVLPALGAAAQQQAPAQPQAAAQPPEIDEVVVTATRIDTSILDSPSLVTVITPRQIAQSGTGDLAGVLASQSGVVTAVRFEVGQVVAEGHPIPVREFPADIGENFETDIPDTFH